MFGHRELTEVNQANWNYPRTGTSAMNSGLRATNPAVFALLNPLSIWPSQYGLRRRPGFLVTPKT